MDQKKRLEERRDVFNGWTVLFGFLTSVGFVAVLVVWVSSYYSQTRIIVSLSFGLCLAFWITFRIHRQKAKEHLKELEASFCHKCYEKKKATPLNACMDCLGNALDEAIINATEAETRMFRAQEMGFQKQKKAALDWFWNSMPWPAKELVDQLFVWMLRADFPEAEKFDPSCAKEQVFDNEESAYSLPSRALDFLIFLKQKGAILGECEAPLKEGSVLDDLKLDMVKRIGQLHNLYPGCQIVILEKASRLIEGLKLILPDQSLGEAVLFDGPQGPAIAVRIIDRWFKIYGWRAV